MGPSDAPTILMYLINLLIIYRFQIWNRHLLSSWKNPSDSFYAMHVNATHKQRYSRKGLDALKVIVSMVSVSYSVGVSYLV